MQGGPPPPPSEEELRTLVREVIAETAAEPSALGAAVPAFRAELSALRNDLDRVRAAAARSSPAAAPARSQKPLLPGAALCRRSLCTRSLAGARAASRALQSSACGPLARAASAEGALADTPPRLPAARAARARGFRAAARASTHTPLAPLLSPRAPVGPRRCLFITACTHATTLQCHALTNARAPPLLRDSPRSSGARRLQRRIPRRGRASRSAQPARGGGRPAAGGTARAR